MDGSEIKVMFGSREVGRIFESSNPLTLCFKYSQEWSLSGFPLSPSMPLNGMFSDEVATFFFKIPYRKERHSQSSLSMQDYPSLQF